ncbi:MAG: VPLPA-CTERM sorting domain-containing protein [Methylococcales bacterium]
MNLKKTALSLALGAALGLSATASQAVIIDMDYSGLFTMLDPAGAVLQNTSYPYYGDPTWGYGLRTQISGTMSFDTDTGAGSGTVQPFEFFNGGPAVASGVFFQSIGNGLMLGNMTFSWGTADISTQIVLNASGLFAEMPTIAVGDTYDAASCAASGACATPASDGVKKGKYPVGPTPIATSAFNTVGQAGFGTTLGQLSLGTDDGIGGSPMDNGPFTNFNANFDMTSITVTKISAIPVPAAVWLFGSGLVGLAGIARRRKQS